MSAIGSKKKNRQAYLHHKNDEIDESISKKKVSSCLWEEALLDNNEKKCTKNVN